MKLIRGDGGTLLLDWYRKPSASSRYIHAASAHPYKYKINAIMGLKNRILRLSHVSFHQSNLAYLKNIFLENGFDVRTINKLLFGGQRQQMVITDRGEATGLPRERDFRSLPMVTGLTSILTTIFRDLPVKIAITSRTKLGNFYTNTKDRTEKENQTNLVYCIPCGDCGEVYVGMTSQRFGRRLAQHRLDVERGRETTALSAHAKNIGHTVDFNNASILTYEKYWNKRAFKEMCFIKAKNNTFNFRKDLESLSPIYHNIIGLASRIRMR